MAETLTMSGVITRVVGGAAVRLRTDRGFVLTIETRFVIARGDHHTLVAPDADGLFTIADDVDLLGVDIVAAHYGASGHLRIDLSDNRTLTVMPDEDIESWQAWSPNGSLTAVLAGGEIVVWN